MNDLNTYLNILVELGDLNTAQRKHIIKIARDLAFNNYNLGYEHGIMDYYEGNLEIEEYDTIINKYRR